MDIDTAYLELTIATNGPRDPKKKREPCYIAAGSVVSLMTSVVVGNTYTTLTLTNGTSISVDESIAEVLDGLRRMGERIRLYSR